MANQAPEAGYFDDPRWVVFGGQPAPEPGMAEDHALFDPLRRLFTRDIEDVKQDFGKVSMQIQTLLEGLQTTVSGFGVDEICVELGFSASGRLVFVAEAGVQATVGVTFRRATDRPEPPQDLTSPAVPQG